MGFSLGKHIDSSDHGRKKDRQSFESAKHVKMRGTQSVGMQLHEVDVVVDEEGIE